MNGNIYKIALIGCGKMGAVHLDSIYFRENIVIQYVCDTNRANAEKHYYTMQNQNLGKFR